MHPFYYLQHGEERIERRTDLTIWVSFLVSATGVPRNGPTSGHCRVFRRRDY